jgi:hypothetical protein
MMKYDGINRYKNLTMNLTDITELTFSTFRGHCHTFPIIVHVVCFLCDNFAFFQFLVEYYRRGKGGWGGHRNVNNPVYFNLYVRGVILYI